MPNVLATDKGAFSRVIGLRVASATGSSGSRAELLFEGGVSLVFEAKNSRLEVTVRKNELAPSDESAPTQRQREYLSFIAKYIARFGRPPAESDIEGHFLVSAPSVNQMMRTLERRGFIKRKPGVPRSTELCIDTSKFAVAAHQ